MRTLLLDADILIYQVSAVHETAIEWHKDFWTLHGDARLAKISLDDTVDQIMDELNADNVVMALSATDRSSNWRLEILPTYKYNRDGRKPLVYKALVQHVLDNYVTLERPTLEGDDVLGILSTMGAKPFEMVTGIKPGERVLVSLDKDLKTIPGLYQRRRGEDIREISEDEANWHHLFQALTGDTTDGYKGCPGIGPKTAKRILPPIGASVPELWEAVVAAYRKKNLGEEAALVQAQVARICRVSDYNFKQKRVIPWTPDN
ncbi:MAG: exonuclease [Proteobacteria bacterium]|nr:exonuclease [Pseudomonadota bacterium]MBU4576012.1 exonuclease [Pseudomonadota bacterium]MBV1715978.1 hypothetical protein [Desulfarculus sp.]